MLESALKAYVLFGAIDPTNDLGVSGNTLAGADCVIAVTSHLSPSLSDVAQVVQNGQSAQGTGLIISSSRGILYASSGADFAGAARAATQQLRAEINSSRTRPA